MDLLTVLVSKSVNFKAKIVSEDEREKGIRRILNFGHTFGHVIEMQKSVKHGLAIASGMELATGFSFEKGLISASEKERIVNLLKRFGIPGKHDIPDNQIGQLIFMIKRKQATILILFLPKV